MSYQRLTIVSTALVALLLAVICVATTAAGTTGTTSGSMWTLGSVFRSGRMMMSTNTADSTAQQQKPLLANHWFHVMELPNGEVMIPWDDERV
jgi:hypothetical protein